MSEKYTEYNYTKEFEDDGIKDHIQEIMNYCKIHKIPFFATFAIANEKGKTAYDNYAVSSGLEEVNLYDDKIKKHVLIYRDFDIAPIGAMNYPPPTTSEGVSVMPPGGMNLQESCILQNRACPQCPYPIELPLGILSLRCLLLR